MKDYVGRAREGPVIAYLVKPVKAADLHAAGDSRQVSGASREGRQE